MFNIVYPMFERGRIMKKELLLALRNYSFGFARLQFADLTDGIIAGCDITVTDKKLTVGAGIAKFNHFIYMMTEPQHVYYEPNEQFTSIKIRFSTTAAATTDFVQYSGNIVLDEQITLRENEMEVCRFKLKRGSRLRNDYTGFEDIQTEFDTVNLADATWAALDRPGICSVILRSFAKEAISCSLTDPWDISFCSQVLAAGEIPHRSVIEAYLASHKTIASGEKTNQQIFEDLNRILVRIKENAGIKGPGGRKKFSIEMH